MNRLISIRKRHRPTWTRRRGPHERIALQLTPAARRALLLENLRAGIPHKLTEQEN